jgi:hypothetical protein
MKFLIAFILCFFCVSFDTSAIYSVADHGISAKYAPSFTPKKPTYKERVVLKYLKLKAKAAKSDKKTRRFAIALAFLVVGIVLTVLARQSNQASPPNGFIGSSDGCLKAVLALLSFATSLVFLIIALTTSV